MGNFYLLLKILGNFGLCSPFLLCLHVKGIHLEWCPLTSAKAKHSPFPSRNAIFKEKIQIISIQMFILVVLSAIPF